MHPTGCCPIGRKRCLSSETDIAEPVALKVIEDRRLPSVILESCDARGPDCHRHDLVSIGPVDVKIELHRKDVDLLWPKLARQFAQPAHRILTVRQRDAPG